MDRKSDELKITVSCRKTSESLAVSISYHSSICLGECLRNCCVNLGIDPAQNREGGG